MDIKLALAAGRLRVTPLAAADIQPASIDCHLGTRYMSFPADTAPLDPQHPPRMQTWYAPDPWLLLPQGVVLYELAERLTLPDDLVARVEGKSSLARLGLTVHLTAGYVDPGWDGVLTLELKNEHADRAILLRPGQKIAQLSFHRLSSRAEHPYGHSALNSHYQGSETVVGSRSPHGVLEQEAS